MSEEEKKYCLPCDKFVDADLMTEEGHCQDCANPPTDVEELIQSWAGKSVTTRHKLLTLKALADKMESQRDKYLACAERLEVALRQAMGKSLGVPAAWRFALDEFAKAKRK